MTLDRSYELNRSVPRVSEAFHGSVTIPAGAIVEVLAQADKGVAVVRWEASRCAVVQGDLIHRAAPDTVTNCHVRTRNQDRR